MVLQLRMKTICELIISPLPYCVKYTHLYFKKMDFLNPHQRY